MTKRGWCPIENDVHLETRHKIIRDEHNEYISCALTGVVFFIFISLLNFAVMYKMDKDSVKYN